MLSYQYWDLSDCSMQPATFILISVDLLYFHFPDLFTRLLVYYSMLRLLSWMLWELFFPNFHLTHVLSGFFIFNSANLLDMPGQDETRWWTCDFYCRVLTFLPFPLHFFKCETWQPTLSSLQSEMERNPLSGTNFGSTAWESISGLASNWCFDDYGPPITSPATSRS
jgi:hypothetical protein